MIRNLDWLRNQATKDIPELGSRLYEALSDIDRFQQAIAQQTNSNISGQPEAPPPVSSLQVTGQNGQFHASIAHDTEFYRDIHYHLEYSTDAAFQNFHYEYLGPGREWTKFLGNGSYFFRAYASYGSSGPSAPAYHGGAGSPRRVFGGGSIGGPAFLPSQGSGTGTPGQGLSGPGPVPFRSATGRPPVRKTA